MINWDMHHTFQENHTMTSSIGPLGLALSNISTEQWVLEAFTTPFSNLISGNFSGREPFPLYILLKIKEVNMHKKSIGS